MSVRVGVDIGGTFTDFAVFNNDTGALHTLKVLSTPDNPGQEVLTGLQQLEERYGIVASDVSYFTHGTTVGVNTVIQRRGLRLVLVTTENFIDVLELARLKSPDPYNLHSVRPTPLVTRERVLGVNERMAANGTVDTPLDETSVEQVLAQAAKLGAEGVVVALLNAYANPVHEQHFKAIAARLAPELPVFCSTDVWSIIREYERTTTAVIHGYVQPRVARYLQHLRSALKEAGVSAEPMVTKSNGGVMRAEIGETQCIQMLLSGTASGVVGANFVANLCGMDNTLSLDIGGTSADVALIRNGAIEYGTGEMVGEFPIFIPTVAVTSIGAGGGSIAWVDPIGVLQVGPRSAGSTPGPACYGRGGHEATVTDAFAVLGYLGQHPLGYGAIEVDREAASRAVGSVAEQIERTVADTAQAIIDIAVSEMYVEVSKLISHHGVDPREFSLQGFGGAGPMLSCFLARELGMRSVVIPTTPGVLSALGGLVADIRNDFIATVICDVDTDGLAVVGEHYKRLEAQALAWLRDEQGFSGDYELQCSADMRYRGQSFEIETPLAPADIHGADVHSICTEFHRAHARHYEHADPNATVQMVNLRLVVIAATDRPTFESREAVPGIPERSDTVDVYIGGKSTRVGVYAREHLVAGHQFD
ncbi:MAG: hydantoinase/oxoprolinase family protein, partial [Chromatiales bacterium]|nr:hydantoinase/oxoprolinase family protein [Chromatiales bacterium]